MSDEFDLDDDLEDEPKADGPKVLRQQVSKLKSQLAALQAERDQFAKRVRQTDIADALEKAGAPKRLAKYVDVEDATPDEVLKWLTENGADFGWTPAEDDDEEEVGHRESVARVQRTAAQAPEGKIAQITPEMIRNASREELQKIYARLA